MNRGSISVFLALVLVPVLILTMALLESVRNQGMAVFTETAGYAAADSVFAGFDRDVFDEYGLLFYDGGFGLGLTQYDRIEEEFASWYEMNLSPASKVLGGSFFRISDEEVVVTNVVHATDYQGMIFVSDALDFYKYDRAGELLRELESDLGLIGTGTEEKVRIPEGRALTSRKNASPEGEEGSEDDVREILDSSLIGICRQVRTRGWISLVLPRGETVSGVTVTTSEFPSVTSVDERKAVDYGFMENTLNKVVFNEYVLDSFSCFTDETEEEGLEYELEYILYGEASDDKNLKKALNRLLVIRESMNLATILASEEMKDQAQTLALVLVGWTGSEGVGFSVQQLLCIAWSFAESLSDLKELLSGGRVPLMKTSRDWRLSLDYAVSFLRGNEETSGHSEKGLNYREYLRLLLFTHSLEETAYRSMDMVQYNEQKKGRCFLMASQIYAMEFRVSTRSEPLFVSFPLVSKETGGLSGRVDVKYYAESY